MYRLEVNDLNRPQINSTKLVRLFYQGLGDREIADRLSCSLYRVYRTRIRLGLLRRRIDRAKLVELFNEGWTDREIADRLHFSVLGVTHARRKLRLLRKVGCPQRIDRNEFFRLYRLHLGDRQIAEKLGCHPTTAQLIRRKELKLPPVVRPRIKIPYEEFLNLYNQGLNDKEIAKHFSTQWWTINYFRRKHGLLPKTYCRLKYEKLAVLLLCYGLYKTGKSFEEISKTIGLTIKVTEDYVQKAKVIVEKAGPSLQKKKWYLARLRLISLTLL